MPNRRTALVALSGPCILPVAQTADALLPALFRILLGTGVRGSATAAGRAALTRGVARTATRGGITKTIQTVTTVELGLTITGVAALSVTAADLLTRYDCKALCVQGVSDTAQVLSQAIQRPTHITIDIFNSITNSVEDYVREYVNEGSFQYSFTLPRNLTLGVKRLEGRADDDRSVPNFGTPNILLAGIDDVFSE